MSNEDEKKILVPLAPAVKERLERVADINGRSTAREAARAIETYVRREGARADAAAQQAKGGEA